MNRSVLLLATVLLYVAVFRLLTLAHPFAYDTEGSSGAFNGVLARNYLRFDLARTRGMPVLAVGPRANTPIVFYADHPPLVPLLIVPFYAAFDVGEWQTRLPIGLVTLATICVLYLLLARTGTRRGGLMAAALFAAAPVTLYFGGFPDVMGMPLVLGVLLSTLAYLRFHRQPGGRPFFALIAAFTLAALCDWPAYVLVPVFVGHFLATRPRREWGWILRFGVLACALFTAVYVYIAVATDAPWDWMAPLFLRHSALGPHRFTLRQWLAVAWQINRVHHTLPLLGAGSIWLVTSGVRVRDSRPDATVARLLIAFGLLCVAIAAKAVYNHEWDWLPLTPGLVVAAALFVDDVLRRLEQRAPSYAAGGIVGACVALFAVWTAFTTFRRLDSGAADRPFTPIDMGQAIRAAAPDPSGSVLLVGGEEAESQLWFYGDRPLRLRVWTIAELTRRLKDPTADLIYDFDVQAWSPSAAGLVFPAVYRRDFRTLWAYLELHYRLVPLPAALHEKFDVFDLRQSLPQAKSRQTAALARSRSDLSQR